MGTRTLLGIGLEARCVTCWQRICLYFVHALRLRLSLKVDGLINLVVEISRHGIQVIAWLAAFHRFVAKIESKKQSREDLKKAHIKGIKKSTVSEETSTIKKNLVLCARMVRKMP
jgi:hypothetical protein